MRTLEILREVQPDGSPRWLLVLGRNRDGTIRNQEEITTILEGAFTEALAEAKASFYATIEARDQVIEDVRAICLTLYEEREERKKQWEAREDAHAEALQNQQILMREKNLEALAQQRDNYRQIIESRDSEYQELTRQQDELYKDIGRLNRALHLPEKILAQQWLETYRQHPLNKNRHHPKSRSWWHRLWHRACCDPLLCDWTQLTGAQYDLIMDGVRAVRGRMNQEAAEPEDLEGQE